MKGSSIKALVGVCLTVTTLTALYFFKGSALNTLTYFVTTIFIALMAGVLTNFIPGHMSYHHRNVKESVFANEGRLVFVFVVLGSFWFFLKTNQTFDFVVYLRGVEGQTILRNQERVQLILNSTPRIEKIDQYGRVVVTGIPAELKENAVALELVDLVDWTFANGLKTDTILLNGQNATLTIKPSDTNCCIRGDVTRNGVFLSGVRVWIKNLDPVISDSIGNFLIKLPLSMRAEESIQVFAHKKNGTPISVRASPRQHVSISFP